MAIVSCTFIIGITLRSKEMNCSLSVLLVVFAFSASAENSPQRPEQNSDEFRTTDAIVHEVDMPEDIQTFIIETMNYGNYAYSGNVWQVAAYIQTQIQKRYLEYNWFISANYQQIAYPYYHKMILSPLDVKYQDDMYLISGLLLNC